GAAGNEIRGFEDHGVALGESRRDLPRGDGERKVPRRDNSDDPERLSRDLDVDIWPDAREFLAGNPQSFAGEEVEDLSRSGRLADAFREGLAFFAREQTPKLLAPSENFGRGSQQNVMPLLRRRPRPRWERGMRGLDRGVRLRGVGLHVFADDVV